MAIPLIPIALRAGLALAKNKKMREALTKSVGGLTKRVAKKTKRNVGAARKAKPPSNNGLSTASEVALGFAGGAVAGKETERARRIKRQKRTGRAYPLRP